jgi:high affinity Mn2+ porin
MNKKRQGGRAHVPTDNAPPVLHASRHTMGQVLESRGFMAATTLLPSLVLAALALAAVTGVRADDNTETWNAHVQGTYVWQRKPGFNAAYSGVNSLSPDRENAYSLSGTAALGWRPWSGGELYFDPEVVQGVPLSNLTGLGGLTNGEQQKTSGANPTFYRARLFLRQTWNLGGEQEHVESAANALAGMQDSRRVVLTAGNMSVLDVFDLNSNAHDPRTQFLNWALTAHGAWDFAADARGYTWGAALEYFNDDWAFRYGRFLQPAESNGLALETKIFTHFGEQVEVAHTHKLGDLPGTVKLLAFRNRSKMASFNDAVASASATGAVPDLALARRDQNKHGFGASIEQAVSRDAGIFLRGSWNDGQTETYAFAEIERSIAAGGTVKGRSWNRPKDTVGVALIGNGLSAAHQRFLAAGGNGQFVGDGRINYRPEVIGEAYYSLNLVASSWLTFDVQRIARPAYNADRGPVTVGSVRLHSEF